MNSQTFSNVMLSFPEVLRVRAPREIFEARLMTLLSAKLKTLNIVWNPKAFRGGLRNPQLPVRLLKKLESLIFLAQTVDWNVSKAVYDELDATIEDIETFNPSFRASLKRASANVKAGRFVTQKELEKQFGIK